MGMSAGLGGRVRVAVGDSDREAFGAGKEAEVGLGAGGCRQCCRGEEDGEPKRAAQRPHRWRRCFLWCRCLWCFFFGGSFGKLTGGLAGPSTTAVLGVGSSGAGAGPWHSSPSQSALPTGSSAFAIGTPPSSRPAIARVATRSTRGDERPTSSPSLSRT